MAYLDKTGLERLWQHIVAKIGSSFGAITDDTIAAITGEGEVVASASLIKNTRLPILELSGDVTDMSKDNAVTLNYTYGDLAGTCTCKWQGSSSIRYPKKNYTIKFDQSFEAKTGWGVHNKYCMKANWVDPSNLRNVYCARLWGDMVKQRYGAPDNLKALPNGGAIDGFPIWIILNGQSLGLYTFSIPKEDWMLGMTGANSAEGFVCADRCGLDIPVTGEYVEEFGMNDVKVEYSAGNESALIASLNNVITVINNVKSAADLAALEAVVDINSVIDYNIHMSLLGNNDGINRNYILATYDGIKWFMSAYDMDSVFGGVALPEEVGYGKGLRWTNTWPSFEGGMPDNKLIDLIRTYYAAETKTRFTELRGWVLNELNTNTILYQMAYEIPDIAIREDFRLWPSRLGTNTGTCYQIADYMRMRYLVLDYQITQI